MKKEIWICNNYALGIEVDHIMQLYKNATKMRQKKIDMENRDYNKEYGHNFTGFQNWWWRQYLVDVMILLYLYYSIILKMPDLKSILQDKMKSKN